MSDGSSKIRIKDKSEVGRDLRDNDLVFITKTDEDTDNPAEFGRIKNQILNEAGTLYTNTTPTPSTVGGISSGTTFENVSNKDMWNMLLYPTLYPTLTNPNNSFNLTQSGLREIGEIITDLNFTSTFNRGSINPAYGTSGYRSGLPNTYHYTGEGLPSSVPSTSLSNSQTINNYLIKIGIQTWTNSVSYDSGEQPKDSIGEDYGTPLSPGTTGAKTVSITGVYPYFATTSDINVLTKQPLSSMSSSYVQVNMVAESSGIKQIIEFPSAWSTITGVEFYNTVSSSWEWIGGSKPNSLSTFTVTGNMRTINGNSVIYDVYTHNGANIGARQLRFYTT